MAFVAETDGKVIGFIQLKIYQLLYEENMVNILGLAVNENYRKLGVGRKLIDKAEEWATEKGRSAIRLNSSMHRKEAHKFYEHMGFVNTKDQKRFVRKIGRRR